MQPHALQRLEQLQEHPIVLFDGVCNLCVGSVQFLIKRDRESVLRYASLQSLLGQALLAHHELPADYTDSVVFIHQGKAFIKSDAILYLMPFLNGFWPVFGIFRVIPRPIRDWVYSHIGGRRYSWFGKRESCWLGTPELRQRFLSLELPEA